MAHGLEIYASDGSTRVSVSDRLTRLVYSGAVSATSSGSATVAGVTTANTVVFAVCTDAPVFYKCPHETWVSDNTIHWAALPTPQSGNDFRQSSLILAFRYK